MGEGKVYIGNLPKTCRERDLEEAFKGFGKIRSVWVARNPPGEFFFFILSQKQKTKTNGVMLVKWVSFSSCLFLLFCFSFLRHTFSDQVSLFLGFIPTLAPSILPSLSAAALLANFSFFTFTSRPKQSLPIT